MFKVGITRGRSHEEVRVRVLDISGFGSCLGIFNRRVRVLDAVLLGGRWAKPEAESVVS